MTPFDTIESAQDFIDLLVDAIEESQKDAESEIHLSEAAQDERRVQALQLVTLNLNKLGFHVTKTRRILNDLRLLRRLLVEQKAAASEIAQKRTAGAA